MTWINLLITLSFKQSQSKRIYRGVPLPTAIMPSFLIGTEINSLNVSNAIKNTALIAEHPVIKISLVKNIKIAETLIS